MKAAKAAGLFTATGSSRAWELKENMFSKICVTLVIVASILPRHGHFSKRACALQLELDVCINVKAAYEK